MFYKKNFSWICSLAALITVSLCVQAFSTKWVVITTINQPTKAVKKLAALKDWRVVIVGDKKTPPDWQYDNCVYLSPEEQLNLGFKITHYLP
jgi:hypothetical protein